MTTRAKRSAESPQIEALIGQDSELLKALMRDALQEVLEAEMSEAVGRVLASAPPTASGTARVTTVGGW